MFSHGREAMLRNLELIHRNVLDKVHAARGNEVEIEEIRLQAKQGLSELQSKINEITQLIDSLERHPPARKFR